MADESARELKRHLTEIGTLLGVFPSADSTPASFANQVKEAARNMKAAAGITWTEYVCSSGSACFTPVAGPYRRFVIREGQNLGDLAGEIGMFEIHATP